MKKAFVIKLCTIDSVKKFVELASGIDGEIAIISGRWVIDGKSIMGIFSLDLIKSLTCEIVADYDNVKLFEEGLRKLNVIQD